MSDTDFIKVQQVVRELADLQDAKCTGCDKPVCYHESLMSISTGFKNDVKCLECLAVELGDGRDRIRDRVFMYIFSRPCFRHAWQWANQQEQFSSELPRCLWPVEQKVRSSTVSSPQMSESFDLPSDQEFDAGEMGCGDLVMQLRMKVIDMKPGQVLKLIARDPGAPNDLPAWCRLTGHTLLSAVHPTYYIRRKES